jgi:hypothetical protein
MSVGFLVEKVQFFDRLFIELKAVSGSNPPVFWVQPPVFWVHQTAGIWVQPNNRDLGSTKQPGSGFNQTAGIWVQPNSRDLGSRIWVQQNSQDLGQPNSQDLGQPNSRDLDSTKQGPTK